MTTIPPWERERLNAPPPPMTVSQAMRDDPAAVAALALALGTALVLVGTVIAGLRSDLAVVGAVGSGTASGFRLRVLAVFDSARLEVAMAPLAAVALLGVTRALIGRVAMNLRRPAFVALGAIGAYIAFAAVLRSAVLFSLLGRGNGNLLGATIEALGAIPLAVVTTAWCAGLLSGDAGYVAPRADDPEEGQLSS